MPEKPAYEELERRVRDLEQAVSERGKTIDALKNVESELKRTKDAFQKSEEKFKLLAEHPADVIYKVSLENERYTYASPSIEKVFGYTVEQILSMEVRDTLTPEAYAKQRGYLETAIIRGQTTQDILEVDVIHKDGHIVSVEIHTAFISDDLGNPVEILGVARDISERKKAETALRESELKEIKTLQGILPLCSFCKKVWDDKGYWEQVDVYIHKHSQADISHGICPECFKNIILIYFHPNIDS